MFYPLYRRISQLRGRIHRWFFFLKHCYSFLFVFKICLPFINYLFFSKKNWNFSDVLRAHIVIRVFLHITVFLPMPTIHHHLLIVQLLIHAQCMCLHLMLAIRHCITYQIQHLRRKQHRVNLQPIFNLVQPILFLGGIF